MSDPAILGRMLIDTPDKDRAVVGERVMKPLRLLPSNTKFSKQIETWAKAALEELATK